MPDERFFPPSNFAAPVLVIPSAARNLAAPQGRGAPSGILSLSKDGCHV
jgi:hypothetical protein